jgi:hypothetical protein
MVALIPFDRWSGSLGRSAGETSAGWLEEARHRAADIEWAAKRLPFSVKCLPRAMALSWKLKQLRIAHSVVIAVRPSQLRHAPDSLHAWVEVGGEKILGALPGPWIETVRLGS